MTKDGNISIKNIYYMLAYVFDCLGKPEYERLEKEDFEDAQDLFAAFLALAIEFLLKKGLYREYVDRQESLATIRGKIDMPNTIRNKVARKQMLSCEFDEFSEDNLLNQILKTVAMFLIKSSGAKNEWKDLLKKEMHYFGGVRTLNLNSIQWPTGYQKNNQSYCAPIEMCKMLVQNMLITTEEGEHRLADFTAGIDKAHLFEKFILKYYKRHRRDLIASAKKIEWALDDDFMEMLPQMKSDIYLQKGKEVLIIDAKHYQNIAQENQGSLTIRSDHLYQILAYVKNCQAKNKDCRVSGMLLYARTDEGVLPDWTYRISGNKISAKTLDMNAPFSDVARQLDEIAVGYFGPVGSKN